MLNQIQNDIVLPILMNNVLHNTITKKKVYKEKIDTLKYW